MKNNTKTALILVDLQNDFCEGGSLAVKHAQQVVLKANQLQGYFNFIIATKDWHPQDHASFASNHLNKKVGDRVLLFGHEQILWPEHCVQHSAGSDFHPQLNTAKIRKIFYKGTDSQIDSYSAFFDNEKMRSTGLGEYLKEHQVDTVFILGLATDYCVKYSCLDAAALGFQTYVIEDACRGVNLQANDVANAFAEMQAAGVSLVKVNDIINSLAISA